MQVNTQIFKQSITEIPNFIDGKFEMFEIHQTEGHHPKDYLKPMNKEMWFEERTMTDRLRYKFEQRDNPITLKIRIPQTKELTVYHVLKIGDEYHKVYNVFHFRNNDGYELSDITLEEYSNPRLEGDLSD